MSNSVSHFEILALVVELSVANGGGSGSLGTSEGLEGPGALDWGGVERCQGPGGKGRVWDCCGGEA